MARLPFPWLALFVGLSLAVGCSDDGGGGDDDDDFVAGDDDDDLAGDDDDDDGRGDPTCDDERQNQGESDVDCGGPCDGCPVGQDCNTDADCRSEQCGDGGTCEAVAGCMDGVQNGEETGLDCGGPVCDACAAGETCAVDGDCASGDCEDGVCRSCADGVQNGDETDIDCGGAECRGCLDAGMCGGDEDCASGRCEDGVCISCSDGVLNGDETDLDCGGAICDGCSDGDACIGDRDCAGAATCVESVCVGGCTPFATTPDYTACERTERIPPCPDISTTGTAAGLFDDDYVDVSIPFTFDFFGTGYTSVRVESNGALTFGSDPFEIDYDNACLPADTFANEAMIAAFWDDLDPERSVAGEPSEIYYETRGVSPSRTFVTQWTVLPFDDDTDGAIDVRAVLFEGTDRIEVCYVDTDTADSAMCSVEDTCHTDGISATAGIQESSTVGLEYSCDASDLVEGLVLRYDPI